ncbi:nacht domain protein [Apiospora aurea]|uniref:Nacht domain protein n=1 Tax=Apiospora aurea TaxID=335848 RepID=A0ABR1PZG5_9PEZI
MSGNVPKREFDQAITDFKRGSGLSREQLDHFQFSSFDGLMQTMSGIQRKQAQDKRLSFWDGYVVRKDHSNEGRRLADDAKDLCASFVEVHDDQTIELVHSTVREFLKYNKIFRISEAEKSLTLISITYLCTEPIDREIDEAVLKEALLAGSYGFLEYASVWWAPHLLSWLQESPANEDILGLAESLELLLDSHFLEREQNIMIPQKMLKTMSPLEDFDIHTSVMQAVVWTRKQIMGSQCNPEVDGLLDFSQIISRFRSSLEMYLFLHGEDAAHASLGKLYGSSWFKCPRMSCRYFHHGFPNCDLRDQHIARHDRAYLCMIEGCITATLGCATRAELQKHMLETHGIIGEEDSFPSMPNPATKAKAACPAKFQCSQCPKTFTRPANLQSHERSHRNERPFACDTCGMTFVRQHDKKRHEETRHVEERRFICRGYLRDGSPWGCQRTFARADVLADHHKSQTGRLCIRALLDEKKAEMGDIPENEILAHVARLTPTYRRVDTLVTLNSSTSLGSEEDRFAELDMERADTFQPKSSKSSSQKRSSDDSGSEGLADFHKAKRFQFQGSYIRHSATQRGEENSSGQEGTSSLCKIKASDI